MNNEDIIKELERCRKDCVYFIEKYCLINGNNIKLTNIQKLETVLKNIK